jgi:hypothetical protein
MLRPARRLLLAGATVAVLGFAAVGAGAVATGDRGGSAPTEVSTAADALLAADTTATGAAPGRLSAQQLRRLAAWRHLVHAQATLDLPALGGLTTVQLDHGMIAAVSATSLEIAEAGGGTVRVTLGSGTRVRRAGAKAAVGDLKAGDEVFAMSRVEPDGTEAYLVVVPKG